MKKIFAISVLSIMTVLSSNAWASDTSVKEAYGIGSAADYNIATVKFVGETAVPQWAGWHNENKILRTDGNSNVIFSDTINQDQVSGLTDALAGKVDDTQIADADAPVPTGKMDTMVPTVQRMANAIAAAVESGVGAVDLSSRVAVDQGTEKANQVLVTGADGKVTTATTITQAQVENLTTDLSGKVDKAQVIKSDDKALSDSATDLSSANADEIVPTVGMVEENFAPRVAQVAYNNGENTYIEKPSDLPYGSYALVVDVYEDQTTYRWVAMSTGSSGSQVGCKTTAYNTCEN